MLFEPDDADKLVDKMERIALLSKDILRTLDIV